MLDHAFLYYLYNKDTEGFFNYSVTDLLYYAVGLFFAFGAAYLAYECNAKETPFVRLLITVLAFLFSGLYLIYYLTRYVIMKGKC